jgi:glycosyltransferase involved in cell wall biosynthesis
MTARVSVIIPTYNRAADLHRALTSVCRQSWRHWEALVVDNHSSDDTAGVIARLAEPRIRMLPVHNNGVVAVSRNLGVAHASGDYVAFLDSDDWWSTDKLERSVEALGRGADIVYHDLYLARSPGERWRWRRAMTRQVTAPALRYLLECGNVLTNSSVVLRRRLLLDIGGLSEDPQLASWEDYDCWLRLAGLTERFTRLPQVLGWYWVGGGNTSSPQRTLRNLARIREIYFPEHAADEAAQLPGWYHYGMGRALFHLGDYPRSWLHMQRAMRAELFPNVRAKALLTLGECLVRWHLLPKSR